MEQKHLLSALGVGVGVGLGLVSGSQAVSRWSTSAQQGITAEELELELQRLIMDGKKLKVTFEEFPYYLSERTRTLLTSAAFVHLNHTDMAKHTRNLAAASRAILLSGPAELYLQTLAKALAHQFKSKLLVLDMSELALKMQTKYGAATESSYKTPISEATLDRVSSFLGSFSIWEKTKADTSCISSEHSSNSAATPKRISNLPFGEKAFLQSLYKVLTSVSAKSSVILYVRDVERLLQSRRFYKLFEQLMNKLSGSVVILGSRILNTADASQGVDEALKLLFPYKIDVKPPAEEQHLESWKARMEEDTKVVQFQDNKNHIAEVLAANDVECEDLGSICMGDSVVLSNHIEEIVVSAISYHLMNIDHPEYRNGKLLISSKSLCHGLSIFQEGKTDGKDTIKLEANVEPSLKVLDEGNDGARPDPKVENAKSENVNEPPTAPKTPEVAPDNEFEKRIRPEVIPADKIGVTFADIGALDETKEILQETVMLPLRRPDLFKGGLLKPCRGILLFGPPGTGKTMLAKAIANEAGASFINVSMSTITSKWFGEDEKNVRALFTLAAKVAPTIIFVDEVDSMLGQRTRAGEHEAMRKIKNEFMSHWDGLLTKAGEQILVLAATNRPFDLDEAIIRRFERRMMVGLPSVESREKILRTLLAKENVGELDYKELAAITEGYSGSDLKNLCVTAAYRPVRELLEQERQKDKEKKQKAKEEGEGAKESTNTNEEAKEGANANEEAKEERPEIKIRPLNMEDLKQAKNQIAASFATEGSVMGELKQWNELYGEGGSRKKEQLSYFL